jgi:hypothetical protein
VDRLSQRAQALIDRLVVQTAPRFGARPSAVSIRGDLDITRFILHRGTPDESRDDARAASD